MAQQWHDAVLVLRLWVPPRPGLQRGCRRDVSLLLYSFVRSFQVVLSERGALVGGSQPLRDRSLGGFEDTRNLCKTRTLILESLAGCSALQLCALYFSLYAVTLYRAPRAPLDSYLI